MFEEARNAEIEGNDCILLMIQIWEIIESEKPDFFKSIFNHAERYAFLPYP